MEPSPKTCSKPSGGKTLAASGAPYEGVTGCMLRRLTEYVASHFVACSCCRWKSAGQHGLRADAVVSALKQTRPNDNDVSMQRNAYQNADGLRDPHRILPS